MELYEIRSNPIGKDNKKKIKTDTIYGFGMGGNNPYQSHIMPTYGPEVIPYHFDIWTIYVPYH